MRRNWIITSALGIGLAAFTILAYSGVLLCDFVSFDDLYYVTTNPRVLAGLSWSGWIYAWTTFECSNWHPLTWLSLELDASVWGMKPFGFHLTNLALHAANAVLLFAVLRQMTGCTGRSASVAALFALHPLHVESVAWVSERKDVLSTFFLLLTTIAYVHYAARPSFSRYGLVVALYALGLLAKPMLVTLPILLLLLDTWPLQRVDWKSSSAASRPGRRSLKWLVAEKIPLLLLAFCDGLATVAAQRIAVVTVGNLPIVLRVANAFNACLWYLQKTMLPLNLTAFYPHPEDGLSVGLVIAGVIVVISISVCSLGLARFQPHLPVGWFWFLISLLPVLGLLQVGGQAYADRYTYVPHIGLFIFVVWEVDAWLGDTTRGRVFAWSGMITVLGLCAFLTSAQVAHWKNERTLWEHAIAVDPENFYAHFRLSDCCQAAGDYQGALDHLSECLKTERGSRIADAHRSCGNCYVELGRPDDAEREFQAALKRNADDVQTLDALARLMRSRGRDEEAAQFSARFEKAIGRSSATRSYDAPSQLLSALELNRQGKFRQAIARFENVIRLSPSSAAYNGLGQAMEQTNRASEAKTYYRRAIELNPDQAIAHLNLARCLIAESDTAGANAQFEEGLRCLKQTVQTKPKSFEAQYNYGNALKDRGEPAQAEAHLRAAIQINPTHGPSHQALGGVLLMQGRRDEALVHLNEACRLMPDDASARLNLGVILLERGDYPSAILNLKHAVRLLPGRLQPLILLASAEFDGGDVSAAMKDYDESRRIDPDWPTGMNKVAWNLCTHPDTIARNGPRAVQLARRVCQATRNKLPEFLDTLAAAYAESGQFEEAIRTAEEAIRLADADHRRDVKSMIESRLILFRRGDPYHQPPPRSAP